jgi:hypothetical protein
VNISESSDVQSLLGWLLNPHLTSREDEARARAAAERLADRASACLAAGIRGRDIAKDWDDLLSTCPGCADCAPPITNDDDAPAAAHGDRATLRVNGFSVPVPATGRTPQT